MRRLLAAALCAMAKGQNSSCGPVRVTYDHAGFGNAFDVLFVAFHWARRCNSRVEIVGDESDRLRRICERLTCAGPSLVANHTCHPSCPPPLMTWKQTPSSAYVQTLGRYANPSVDASVFAPARGGAWFAPVWKSKFYDAFVLNHSVVLHAIDATPARCRGDAGSSPPDGASTAASSPRNDLVKNCRVHPTHWLISTQVAR